MGMKRRRDDLKSAFVREHNERTIWIIDYRTGQAQMIACSSDKCTMQDKMTTIEVK